MRKKLDDLKDRIFLSTQEGDVLVVTERLLEIIASETTAEIMETGLAACRLHESLQKAIFRLIKGKTSSLKVAGWGRRLTAALGSLTSKSFCRPRGRRFRP